MKGRERATVLAALRVYQQQLEKYGGAPPQYVEDIATNMFEFEPMSSEEIDGLCERMNAQSLEPRAPQPATAADPARYLYRPMLRPAGFATMPAGLKWDYVEVPREIAHLRQNLPVSAHRYGVIACERELTEKERHNFDLEPVREERTPESARETPGLDEGMDEDMGESR